MWTLCRCSLWALVLAYLVNWLVLYPSEIKGTPRSLPQTELKQVNEVLGEGGTLWHSGYSKTPIENFDDSPLKYSWRYKKWDFYSVFLGEITLAVAIADLGYVRLIQIGNAFVMVYEHGKEGITYETLIPPFSALSMSPTSTSGSSSYFSDKWHLSFNNDSPLKKTVTAKYGKVIDAQLIYSLREQQEGISTFLPMSADGSHFFFSHKQYGYALSGSLTYKGKSYDVSKGLGAMDWGRGVWPYRSFWVWASASGLLPDGQVFALNTGIFLGEFGQATDDFVTVGDRNVKLGVVTSPQANSADLTAQWTFSTLNSEATAAYGSLHATFTPDQSFNKEVNLWVIHSQLLQIFGTFSGKVVYSGGEVQFKNVRGWLEKHLMRW